MKVRDLSMYGSHIPILCKVLEITDGPVLDVGMGLSTIVMHMMAKETGRKIVSYETDHEWYEANKQYQSDFHDIRFVASWDDADIDTHHWSVALVDHAPAKRRITEIKRLAANTDFLMIHDTEPESNKFFRYSWIWKYFQYRYNYTACRPNTTVVSNTFDVEKILTSA